jgi:ribosome-binding factor A
VPGKKGSGLRPARLGELIRQELADMLMNGFVRDLEHAKVHVSVFTDDAATRDDVLDALGGAARAMRRELSHRLTMRQTPELHFRYDGSLVYGAHIEGILREVRGQGDAPAAGPATPSGAEGEGDDRP